MRRLGFLRAPLTILSVAAQEARASAVRPGPTTIPERQPDVKLRELNRGPVLPGPRENIYCTKIGSKLPGEMYIVSAHMDGIGYGEAANDDG